MPSLHSVLCTFTRLSIGFTTLLAIVEYVCRPRDPYSITPGLPGFLEVESPAKRFVDSMFPRLIIATLILGPGSVLPFTRRGRECTSCTCTCPKSVPPSTKRPIRFPSPSALFIRLRIVIGNTLKTVLATLASTPAVSTSFIVHQFSKIPRVLRKPAVFNGRGIENLFTSILPSIPTFPIPASSGVFKTLRKPAVDNGRGIESLNAELNNVITDALRDLEDLHDWARATGIQWNQDHREMLENSRMELEGMRIWALANAGQSQAVETARSAPVPAEIVSAQGEASTEEKEEGGNVEERIEEGNKITGAKKVKVEDLGIDVGEFFEFAEAVDGEPAGFVIKVEEEMEVDVDVGKFFKLAEKAAEVDVDVGKFFKLAEKSAEIDVDVGRFFKLAEKPAEIDVDVGRFFKLAEKPAEINVDIGKFFKLAEKVEEVDVDIGEFFELAEKVEDEAIQVVVVAGEVEHAAEKVEETTKKVEGVVEQVLGEAEAVEPNEKIVDEDKVKVGEVEEETEEAASKRRMAMWEAEARAKDESTMVPTVAPKKYCWDEDWATAEDDNDVGEWFTISKGKTIKTSTLSSSRPAPPALPITPSNLAGANTTATSSVNTTQDPSSAPAPTPAPAETVAEAAAGESQKSSWSSSSTGQGQEWRTARRAPKLPAFPPEAPPVQQRYRIVPANEPNWREARAERYRREMEAWHDFKEAERAAERGKIEEEERKVREAKEAKAARIAKFDTAMSRIDELLKAAKEAKEKWEKEKEENEKALKKIDMAQGRIGELVDLEKVRNLFDPELLESSSLLSTATQVRIHPDHNISKASSSSSAVTEATILPNFERPDTSLSSSPISSVVEVTALPDPENVETSSNSSTVVEETTPPTLEISESTSSSAVPMSYASPADLTTFQSNAAERSEPPQTLTEEEKEERRRKAKNKATEERRKRRKKAHAKWLAQQAEAAHDGESSGSGEAR
ncbi:hypothetical protein C0995_009583 [Termitomyces sp. Mi166|nr:hypothetical protein C0995_009583 [Termitomyces sp. Mi166\